MNTETAGKSVAMSPFGASNPVAKTASKAAPSVSLTSIALIDPPGDTTRASHLMFDDNSGRLYAGYKALGSDFKGGVDILDASTPTNILNVSSLGADNLDVQEVTFNSDANALFVAGAARPSSLNQNIGSTPALLAKVTDFNNPQTELAPLPDNVGKAVVNAPTNDNEHDVYIATDEENVFRFDANLGNEMNQTLQGSEIRSIATTESNVLTVDRDASVFASDVSSANPFSELQTVSSGVGNLAIGRLHARDEPVLNGGRLFLALGSEGLAVLDAANGDVLFRDDGRTYTSVTLHEDDPNVSDEPLDAVYAARPDGIIDVFKINENGVGTGGQNVGLSEVGTFDLSELGGVNVGESPQVNQVMGIGCNIYVANSNEGIVSLRINGGEPCTFDDGEGDENRPPTAQDDSDQTTEGQPTTTDVLANDTDDGNDIDESTVTVQSGPSDGSVGVDGQTGEITYTPDSGFTGSDSYTYTVKDGDGAESNEATVTITIGQGNQAPTANDDSDDTTEGQSTTTDVLANDSDSDGSLDASTVTVQSGPSDGSVSVDGSTGAITYTPDGGFTGSDSYTYTVKDDDGAESDEATVTITVNAVNTAPTANDDSDQTPAGQSTTTDVLGNDSDPDGSLDASTVTVQSGPSDGSVSVEGSTGEITYTPDSGFTGSDSYTYTVEDGDGAESGAATVTVSVSSANTAAADGCSGALGGGVAFTDNGDLKTVPGDGGGVSLLYNTPSNAPVRTLGTGVDLDDDGNVGVVFVQENPNGNEQALQVIDKDATSPTAYSLPHPVKAQKSLLNVGSWDGSGPSAFYVAAVGNGDQIFRVSFNTGNTHAVANPDNGVDAIIGIADIDGDNNDELVFSDGSEDTRYVEQGDSFNQAFAEVPDGGAGSNNNIGIGSCLADVDGDGRATVPIVEGSNQIKLVDAQGVDDTIVTGTANEQAAKTPLAWGDVDDDGTAELVYLENNNSPAELKYVDDVGGANSFKVLRDDDGDRIEGDTERGLVSAQ